MKGIFSGLWVSDKYIDVAALQHADKRNLHIYAIHDDGWTKMVGYNNSGKRTDGRYKRGNIPLNVKSLREAWDIPDGKNVHELYYKISFKLNDILNSKLADSNIFSHVPFEKSYKHIFIIWFQGFHNLPEICEKCYNSWKYKNPGWDIHFIDNLNIHKYIE